MDHLRELKVLAINITSMSAEEVSRIIDSRWVPRPEGDGGCLRTQEDAKAERQSWISQCSQCPRRPNSSEHSGNCYYRLRGTLSCTAQLALLLKQASSGRQLSLPFRGKVAGRGAENPEYHGLLNLS
eukprot:6483608-Amphidinium_carterae.3